MVVILVILVKVIKVKVIKVVSHVLIILFLQGSTEVLQQVAQEAQNVREAEGTVLTTTTG